MFGSIDSTMEVDFDQAETLRKVHYAAKAKLSAQVALQSATRQSKLSTAAATGNSNAWRRNVDDGQRSWLCRTWNKDWAVGVGHFLQGLFGVAAFRACYNRAAGNTVNRKGLMRVSYVPGLEHDQTGLDAGSRTRDQAWVANSAEKYGLFNPIGMTISAGAAILGLLAGGIVRLAHGTEITEDDLNASWNSHRGNARQTYEASQQKLAANLCKFHGVKSVAQGLRMVRSRSSDYPEPDPHPDVRAFRAMQHFVFNDKCASKNGFGRTEFEFAFALNLLHELHGDDSSQWDYEALDRDLRFIAHRFQRMSEGQPNGKQARYYALRIAKITFKFGKNWKHDINCSVLWAWYARCEMNRQLSAAVVEKFQYRFWIPNATDSPAEPRKDVEQLAQDARVTLVDDQG